MRRGYRQLTSGSLGELLSLAGQEASRLFRPDARVPVPQEKARDWDVAQVAECLWSMHKAVGSIPGETVVLYTCNPRSINWEI